MIKIVSRLLLIGLILFVGWRLWTSYSERNNGEIAEEAEITKADEDLTFEIKKGDGEVEDKIIKKIPAKPTLRENKIPRKNTPEVIPTKASDEEAIVDETITEEVVTTESEKNSPVQNIAKFAEGEVSNEISVYFYEYGIDLSTKEVPAGNIIFKVINSGRLSHNLTIKSGSGQIAFGRVAPGETKYFQANFAKSVLKILSVGQTDESNNMMKTLTVK